MGRDKLFDDLAGVANGVAGLASDALTGAREKADQFQKILKLTEEVESLKVRIEKLEAQVEKQQPKVKKGK